MDLDEVDRSFRKADFRSLGFILIHYTHMQLSSWNGVMKSSSRWGGSRFLNTVHVDVVPWSEILIVPSYPHYLQEVLFRVSKMRP